LDFQFTWIQHGSADYSAWVELREPILRTPLGLEYTQADLDAEKEQLHLVAKSERILGGLILVPGESGGGKIRQVAVDESLQGKGIGRKLMQVAEKRARELGIKEIVLHSREPVCKFYESLGYVAEGELFLEVGIAHRKMRKRL